MTVNSLQVTNGDKVVFQHTGKWLYPLLDLTLFFDTNSGPESHWLLEDRIIGKAAALLIQRLGFKHVKTPIISKPAVDVFKAAEIAFSAVEIVEKIDCQTEQLLAEINAPEEAYIFILNRVKSR